MASKVEKKYLVVEGNQIVGELTASDIADPNIIGKLKKGQIIRETTQWQYVPIVKITLKKEKAMPIRIKKPSKAK